eukprot:jgi/Tetstr1/420969/TSEL_012029.t1
MELASVLAAWSAQEAALAEAAAVSLSQLQFILAFLASFPLSAALNYVPTATGRHLYSAAVGIALIYWPFGASIVYIAPPCVVAYLGMRLMPARASAIAWLTVMPYLIYWHENGASGTAWQEGRLDFTGALMVVTLKLISCATNVSDSHKEDKHLRPSERQWMIRAAPTPLEFVSYVFATGNLLAGPHFHVKTYLEYIERRGLWSPTASHTAPNPIPQGLLHLGQALVCLLLHVGLTHAGLGASALTSDWFFELPYLGRMGMLWVCGITARWKYYFVWSLAHASMVVSGFSFEGFNEAGKPMWDRGRNQHIRGLELCPSGAEITLNWNIQTGLWLRRYVYDRLTPIGTKPGFAALMLTQLVSGVWHGLFPGYIMFFSGTALLVQTSREIYRYQRHMKGAAHRAVVAAHTLLTSICLNFLASAFQLLTWQESIRVWACMYYAPVALMLGICVIFPLLPKPRAPRPAAPQPPPNGTPSAQLAKDKAT